MNNNTQNTEAKNTESRNFAIAQIQAVIDANKAKREASAKAHLDAEKAKW